MQSLLPTSSEQKPYSVRAALGLMILATAMSGFFCLITILDGTAEDNFRSFAFLLWWFFLISVIRKGKSWARVLFSWTAIFGFLFSVPGIQRLTGVSLVDASVLSAYAMSIVMCLFVTAVAYLWQKSSSEWFCKINKKQR